MYVSDPKDLILSMIRVETCTVTTNNCISYGDPLQKSVQCYKNFGQNAKRSIFKFVVLGSTRVVIHGKDHFADH